MNRKPRTSEPTLNQLKPCFIGGPSSRHRAQSCALRSCMRWNRTIGMTSTSSRRTATAEESGQSRLLKNSLHSVLPIIRVSDPPSRRSEEHTSELQSLMRISYAVFCLKKKILYKLMKQ